ncbi:MAG: plasmid mobilization relaxosome protein MobC [Cytophagales bacterium]|jgi:regulator of sigma D|nr:plasmid mobilization relaxosome protein MobC [Cytophagales bacterium]
MKAKQPNRSRLIGLRLTPEEYEKLEKKWRASTCRKLSDYVRKGLFEKPITTLYRNRSLDELIAEASRLRSELNGIASNFNQAVKKLHTLQQIAEFRTWILTCEVEKKLLLDKIDQIKDHIRKIAEQWLQ